MWLGIENLISRVPKGGVLFVALYNDQGWKSHFWWFIKSAYTVLPNILKPTYAYAIGIAANLLNILKYTLRLRPMAGIRPLMEHKKKRGMSLKYDLIDWIGGFPYEFVRYEVLEKYMGVRGFSLARGQRAHSLGCHEMVFKLTVSHRE